MFGHLSKETYWLHSKPISEASKYDLLTNTELWWSFQDGRQLASKPVHHNNELLDPILFLSICASYVIAAMLVELNKSFSLSASIISSTFESHGISCTGPPAIRCQQGHNAVENIHARDQIYLRRKRKCLHEEL